jgi:hypothetical protein
MAMVLWLLAVVGCASFAGRQHAESTEGGSTSSGVAQEHRVLTGAELYAINCNRCHPERSPVERTATEWQTILIHMRVRANLPASQARTILEYLQSNSGS